MSLGGHVYWSEIVSLDQDRRWRPMPIILSYWSYLEGIHPSRALNKGICAAVRPCDYLYEASINGRVLIAVSFIGFRYLFRLFGLSPERPTQPGRNIVGRFLPPPDS
jgi:hypothetical protein